MVYTGDLKFPAARLMGSSPIPDTKLKTQKTNAFWVFNFVVWDGTRKPEPVYKTSAVSACRRGGVEILMSVAN